MTKGQITAVLVRLMNDLHNNRCPCWGIRMGAVVIRVKPESVPDFMRQTAKRATLMGYK